MPSRTGSPRALRLRQDWPLVGTCCALVAVVTGIFGSTQVRPWATSSATSRTDEDVVTQDITGKLDLFDQDVGHTIALRFDEKRYQEMVSTNSEDGEKEYIPADLPLDSTVVQNVGTRLKGGSTLLGLRQNRVGADGGPGVDGHRSGDRQGDVGQQGQAGQDRTGTGARPPPGRPRPAPRVPRPLPRVLPGQPNGSGRPAPPGRPRSPAEERPLPGVPRARGRTVGGPG